MLTERVVDDDEQLTPRYTDVFAAWSTFEMGVRSSMAARVLDEPGRFRSSQPRGASDDIDSAGKGIPGICGSSSTTAGQTRLQMNTLLAIATVNQYPGCGRH